MALSVPSRLNAPSTLALEASSHPHPMGITLTAKAHGRKLGSERSSRLPSATQPAKQISRICAQTTRLPSLCLEPRAL